MCERLDNLDSVFDYVKPDGSYLMFPKILLEEGKDSISFCKNLLKEAKVSTTPGIAFGPTGESHLRLSFCVPEEMINKAFASNLLSWKNSGFSIDASLRLYKSDDKTQESIAQYLVRPRFKLHTNMSSNQRIQSDLRKGQHSIRINNQWRVCFVWKNENAFDVIY